MRSARFIRSSLVGLAISAAAMGLAAGAASAACSSDAQELIKNLNGSWRGGGTVQPIGGAKERISCRVDYQAAGSRISQKIACAGTDYKFDADARVSCEGSSVSGTWTEKVANNTGSVSGDIQGKRLNIEVDGPNFKGRFAVHVDSRSKHSLTITQFDPGAGRHVPVATIALSR
jgi:hypothetical protein